MNPREEKLMRLVCVYAGHEVPLRRVITHDGAYRRKNYPFFRALRMPTKRYRLQKCFRPLWLVLLDLQRAREKRPIRFSLTREACS